MITASELRKKYLEFFKNREHAVISSASLIPENDPTVLFTTAGMHPLVPYLLGETHPEGKRLTNTQKCVRTADIDEVGDLSHLTFFEMLGNWSLGDYFKEESIKWAWEFVCTSTEGLQMDKNKLSVTVFGGDERYPDLKPDLESIEIWKKVGVDENRIAQIPGGVVEKEDNWWGPAGQTGPCGPSTEVYYWIGEAQNPPVESNVATDPDNWLEIWNVVLMEYKKTINNTFEPLQNKNIDTGMGLERVLVVLNKLHDVYQIDTLRPLIKKIQEISGREYTENHEVTMAMRIIADHIRSAVMIVGDQRGVAPSNTDQGYIVRRLIRRSIRQGHTLGIEENFCSKLVEKSLEIFGEVYPEIGKNKDFILTEITKEESKFRNTLEKGLKMFDKKVSVFELKDGQKIEDKDWNNGALSGKDMFDLYQTYGFPLELSREEAKKRGLIVEKEDIKDFHKEMKKHQELSRQGAEDKFKGGLADTDEMSTKYHTATHLLQAALRKVLGEHVGQKGSNITSKRLRFDFSHPQKLTDEEKNEVEELVNEAIKQNYKVSWQEMSVEEAKNSGAIGLFEDRYGAKVKVYTVGEGDSVFSKEICGGPHVKHTGELEGVLKIKKEKASSSGVRRIKAILE